MSRSFKIIGSGSSRQRPRSKSAGEQVEKETKTVAARSIIFLTSRRPDPRTGSLLVSLESGLVQAWSHQPGSGGFCGAFTAVHVERDYVKSLATDPENQYLITGHIAGYIKVWLLANYAMADPPKVSVPLLRLEFPFMRKDGILPRAKRAVRDQPSPLLLSSVKSHTKPVNSLEYLPLPRIIISGSADGTVRLWSLGGRYVATLGTFHPWSTLLPDVPLNSYFKDYRVPPDLERVASWTSLKVLRGGDLRLIRGQNRPVEAPDHSQFTENEQKLLYGTRIDPDLFLQKYSEDSSCKSKLYGKVPMLDCSLAYIPVYAHLNSHPVRRIDPHQLPPAKSKTKANN